MIDRTELSWDYEVFPISSFSSNFPLSHPDEKSFDFPRYCDILFLHLSGPTDALTRGPHIRMGTDFLYRGSECLEDIIEYCSIEQRDICLIREGFVIEITYQPPPTDYPYLI